MGDEPTVLDDGAPWARRTDSGWTLSVRVQPGARRSEVVGPHGDDLKVRVAARAVDGKANAALVDLLATHLGIDRRRVTIARGHHHRTKVVEIADP